MTNWERSLVGLIMFPVAKDAGYNARIRAAFERWVELAAAKGWVEYRAPTVYQDLVWPGAPRVRETSSEEHSHRELALQLIDGCG